MLQYINRVTDMKFLQSRLDSFPAMLYTVHIQFWRHKTAPQSTDLINPTHKAKSR